MTIRRGKHSHDYSIVPNELFRKGLTAEACGVLVYLIGKPEHWKVNAEALANQFVCGRERILRILNELKLAGYVETRTLYGDGRLMGKETVVYDTPIVGKPDHLITPPIVSTDLRLSTDQYIGPDGKPSSGPQVEPPAFEEFWGVYPRHIGKAPAEREWKKLSRPDREAAIEDCRSRVWPPDAQFIPHARTYLHQKRWEDEEDESRMASGLDF